MKRSTSVETVPAQKGDDAVTVKIPFAAAYPLAGQEAVFDQRYHDTLAWIRHRVRRAGVPYAEAKYLATDILNSLLIWTSFEHPEFQQKLWNRTRSRWISCFRSAWDRRRLPLPEDWDVADWSSDDSRFTGLDDQLDLALRRLSSREQELLHHRFWNSLTLEEIVERGLLPLSLSGVKSLSARTLKRLRRMLGRAGCSSPEAAQSQLVVCGAPFVKDASGEAD